MISNDQNQSSRQPNNDLQEITLMTDQSPMLSQSDGVERISVDPHFISTVADKKNSLSETIQKEYEKYKHLPAPVRYLIVIPFLGFFAGFYCLASQQFAIGGPLFGVSVATLLAVDRWAKSNQRKIDNLIKQRDNPVVLDGNVVCRDNSDHSITSEARPNALEARLLNIRPQPSEPMINLAPKYSPRGRDSKKLDSCSRYGPAQL